MLSYYQKGFSLIELAVVLVVVGFVLGGAGAMVVPYIESYRHKATEAKLEKIADALAVYAQTYYSLPCPANSNPGAEGHGVPPGYESSNGFNHVQCQPSRLLGIVPYRLLGLTETDIKDAYGNYITYVVAQMFDAYKADIGKHDTNFTIQRKCMGPEWTAGNYVWNMNKAKFCCPAYNANYIRILDGNPTDGHDLFLGNYGSCGGNALDGQWGDTPPVVPGSCKTPNGSEAIAFVLISHGRGGNGAFLDNGTRRTFIGVDSDVDESWNVDSFRRFISRSVSLDRSSKNYFDDIIIWRTNHQLISAFGTDSCEHP